MHLTNTTLLHGFSVTILALGLGCGADNGVSSATSGLRGGERPPQAGGAGEGGDEDGDLSEMCPHGGAVSAIRVEFRCDSIEVESCKDLSNVVLEFDDGTRERFEGLTDQTGSFSGTGDNDGKTIVRVWIKAGSNSSGDGPGYGEGFEAPDDSCADGGTPAGDGDGDGDAPGDGDGDGDGCGLDGDCGGEAPPAEPTPVDCDVTPEDPNCMVD